MTIPHGEIMGQVHIPGQSDKAHATNGVHAGKYYQCNYSRGYNLNHFLNIAQPANGLPASQLMTITRDSASRLLNGRSAKRFKSQCYLHRQQCPTPALDRGSQDSSVSVINPHCQSSRKLKPSYPIGVEHMLKEEVKARYDRIRNEYDYHQWSDPGTM